MRRIRTTMCLTLLVLIAAPVAVPAWERGKVERFATLPPGEKHPEGIEVDREGNVYVATTALNKPDTSTGTLLVFDRQGQLLRQVKVAGSTKLLLDVRFHPLTGALLVIDFGGAKILTVNPRTGASMVFMTVTGHRPGLDVMAFDDAGNVYTTDAHQGIIWKVGKDGGEGTAWVKSPLLATNGAPRIGANGLAFNNKRTALFVSNTGENSIVKIPVTGSPLTPGTPEVFVYQVCGAPDNLIIDEQDNIWIACKEASEVVIIEPTKGRVIARLGDFDGIGPDGAPRGFAGPAALVFQGDEALVTNLSLPPMDPDRPTVYAPWHAEVTTHTISKIKKRIPSVLK